MCNLPIFIYNTKSDAAKSKINKNQTSGIHFDFRKQGMIDKLSTNLKSFKFCYTTWNMTTMEKRYAQLGYASNPTSKIFSNYLFLKHSRTLAKLR